MEHRYGDYAGFYIFVPGQMQYAILPDWRVSKQSVHLFIRDDRIVTAALRDIMASHEFSGVYEETLVYLGYVRSCWNNHFLKIANYFSELFGRQLGTTLAVLVFPSRMRLGSYLGMNTIEWGSADIYAGYQAIGLAHEAMHALTERLDERGTESEKWLLHALIYLAVDEDLRLRLFEHPAPFDPHIINHYDPRLVTLARMVMPKWRTYRNNNQGIKYIYKKLRMSLLVEQIMRHGNAGRPKEVRDHQSPEQLRSHHKAPLHNISHPH